MTGQQPSDVRNTATGERVAFVTGATGFLGLNLVDSLTTAGWKVIALVRPTSDLTYLKRFPCELAEGSIEDAASLDRAVPRDAGVIFHVAGDVSFWSQHRERQTRTNVQGTKNIVATALKRNAFLIHTSSTSVYGFQSSIFDETAAHLGKGSWFHYMHTKALAEEEVRSGIKSGLRSVFLNPANIIGAYDRQNWARLIILAAKGKLPTIPPGRGSFCHASEVARAHIAAVDRGRVGENYILAGADASFAEVIRTIGDIVGRKVPTRVARPGFLRRAGRVLGWWSMLSRREPLITPESAVFLCADLTCRGDKAVRELGYQPPTLRAMLEDSYRWLVKEGLLRPQATPA
jgi:nucleoside-diphosphate-sugar epimerase